MGIDVHAITDNAIEALRLYTFQSSFGIVVFSQDGSVEVGSGFGLQVAGRFFVITAAHVLAGRRETEIRLAYSKEFETEPCTFARCYPRPGDRLPSRDVGYLELDSAVAEATGKSFLDLRQLRIAPPIPGDDVFLVGYPRDLIDRRPPIKRYELAAIGYLTSACDLTGATVSVDSSNDIVLEYGPSGIRTDRAEEIEMPAPFGMSGGALWAVPPVSESLWSAESARVVGVQRARDPKVPLVLATQIKAVVELLRDHYSDLASVLSRMLRGHEEVEGRSGET